MQNENQVAGRRVAVGRTDVALLVGGDSEGRFWYDYSDRGVGKQVATWSGSAWTVTGTRRTMWDGWRRS